jgi:hypothetical protein
MFAIRARRKVATERDFLDAVEKVVRQGTKFSSTYVPSYNCMKRGTDNSPQAPLPGVQLDVFDWMCIILSRPLCYFFDTPTIPLSQALAGILVSLPLTCARTQLPTSP